MYKSSTWQWRWAVGSAPEDQGKCQSCRYKSGTHWPVGSISGDRTGVIIDLDLRRIYKEKKSGQGQSIGQSQELVNWSLLLISLAF